MEPNKLENDFRNKLSQREIQPSEKAWDRLDAMLSVNEKKKPNRTWMYVAASFLGFLLIGSLFFNQSKTGNIENSKTVVLENKETKPNEIIKKPLEIKQEAVAFAKNYHQEKEPHQAQQIIKNEPVKSQVVEKSVAQEIVFHDLKAQEVAQQIIDLEKSGKSVSEEEINNLLEKAKQDIASQRLFNKMAKKVDATALLLDAEKGLDNSFKQRVFDLLKEGYKETKTFIAERNN